MGHVLVGDEHRRFEDVVEGVADALIVRDAAGHIVAFNAAAGRIWGFRDAEQAERATAEIVAGPPSWMRMLDAEGREMPHAEWPICRAVRHEPFRDLEALVVDERSGRRWVGRANGVAVPGPEGGRGLFVVTIEDVTARREAEAALRAREERLRLAVRATNDAIWDWHVGSDRTEWGEAIGRVFGWPEAVGGANHGWWLERVHPGDRPRVDAEVNAVLAGAGEVGIHEYRFRRGDGSYAEVLDRYYVQRDGAGRAVRLTGAVMDVTARKRAEEALRVAEERTRLATRVVNAGTWDWDIGQGRGWWSPEMGGIFGCSEAESDGASYLERVHPDDRAVLRRLGEEVLAGRARWEVRFRIRHPVHGERWIASHGHLERDAAGRPVRLSGLNFDVTARRQAELERERLLAEAEAARRAAEEDRGRLERMLARMTDAFLTFDHEGRFTYLNPKAVEYLGRDSADLIGRVAWEAFPEAVGTEIHTELLRAHDEQVPVAFEAYFLPTARWCEVRGFPSPEGLSVFVSDVTERKRAEAEVQRSTALLRQVTDSVPVHIGYIDREGRYRFNNAAYERTFGRPREWLLGRHVREVVGEAAWAVDEPHFVGALAGHAARFEVVTAGADGGTWVADVRFLPDFGPEGEVRGVHVVSSDITRLKQAEHALREANHTLEARVAERTAQLEDQAARLRHLAAELTDSEQRERRRLAEVIHDHLQQLLVAARLRLAGARRRVDDPATTALLDEAASVLEEATSVSRSLSAELRPPVLYDTGLGAALEWLASRMRDQHGLVVAVRTDARAEPADDRVRAFCFTAARELLFNVVKHAGATLARLDLRPVHGGRLRLRVEDTGRGFEPAAPRGAGAGLGLFSIRERLRAAGGDVVVRSAPGRGTRVDLYVPLNALPGTDAGLAGEARTRVLVVSDHLLLRQLLAGALDEQATLEVVGLAAGLDEALSKARGLRPAVAVVAADVPGGGAAAADRFRTEIPDVQVVGFAVDADAGVLDAMREAGAVACVARGDDPDQLVRTVRELGAARRRPAPAPPPRPQPTR